jgi:hypothetical protein
METDAVPASGVGTDAEVMAAVEDGPVQTLVIADVSRDDAYLTLPLGDAVSLPAWR